MHRLLLAISIALSFSADWWSALTNVLPESPASSSTDSAASLDPWG
jgi:hypothetical protein